MAAKSTHAAPNHPHVFADFTFTLVSVALGLAPAAPDPTDARAKVWGIGTCLKADAIGVQFIPVHASCKGDARVSMRSAQQCWTSRPTRR